MNLYMLWTFGIVLSILAMVICGILIVTVYKNQPEDLPEEIERKDKIRKNILIGIFVSVAFFIVTLILLIKYVKDKVDDEDEIFSPEYKNNFKDVDVYSVLDLKPNSFTRPSGGRPLVIDSFEGEEMEDLGDDVEYRYY